MDRHQNLRALCEQLIAAIDDSLSAGTMTLDATVFGTGWESALLSERLHRAQDACRILRLQLSKPQREQAPEVGSV